MMKEWDATAPTLAKVLSQFVGEIADAPGKDLRILDISGLPNEVAGPLTATLARLLFRYKVYQSKEERAKGRVSRSRGAQADVDRECVSRVSR